jgi:hypothetical protein
MEENEGKGVCSFLDCVWDILNELYVDPLSGCPSSSSSEDWRQFKWQWYNLDKRETKEKTSGASQL